MSPMTAHNHLTGAPNAATIPEQQGRLRTAAHSNRAGNSELEPDDRQNERNREPDRQGGEGREVGGRDPLFAGGMQRGQRALCAKGCASVTPHEIGAPEHAGPRRSEDNAASQVLTPGAVAGAAQSVGSAGESYELEVTTPLARILSHNTAPTADGSRPRCEKCGRGFYVCICNVPEPDVMPASDVCRIMDAFFPDSGWGLSERSALGMTK